MATSDEILMARYKRGEAQAFQELYQRHSKRVYSYLLKRLGRRQDADELHQAVFLKFHRSRDQYDPAYPVLQWLFVISKTTLLDFYRSEGRRNKKEAELAIEEAIQKQSPGIPELSQTEVDPALTELNGLSSEQRQAVEWRYLDELTYEEIARRLGKSEQTIRQVVSRALKKLKIALAAKGSES